MVLCGGLGLVVADNKVGVLFGFGGTHELADIHSFDLKTESWQLVETSGKKPSPRSVLSCFVVGNYIIVYEGEVDPSDKGHLDAGAFSNEAFTVDFKSLSWHRVDDQTADSHPGPQGCIAYSSFKFSGTDGMLVYGGNSPTDDKKGKR